MISVSNIAWEVSEDNTIAELMQTNQCPYVDIAPPKYFSSLADVTIEQIEDVLTFWKKFDIVPLGMQSLLFGTEGLSIFGNKESQKNMLTHLTHVCRIGDGLSARRLVFGSPKNRQKGTLSFAQAKRVAADFFRQLGDVAQDHNVIICLEPNPKIYQCDFMTNSLETAEIVDYIHHPNIGMQLDIGAMCINNEDAIETIPQVAQFVQHIHISEPKLAALNPENDYHRQAAEGIKNALPNMSLSIEMLTSKNNSAASEIKIAIDIIKHFYLGIR